MNQNNISINAVNEDGTDTKDFPQNPLRDKWKKLYPQIPKPEYAQICDGYSCMWCERCPMGEFWTIPKEDIEEWNKYKEQVNEYHKIHNPQLFKVIEESNQKVRCKKLND